MSDYVGVRNSLGWYKRPLTKAIEGQVADSTNIVRDTLAATAEIIPGHPVALNGAGQCQPITSDTLAAAIVGVASHSHTQPQTLGAGVTYEPGDAVPVVTWGDVYVVLGIANTTPNAAAAVAAETENSASVYRFVPYTSGTAGQTAVIGATILDTGSAGDLVRLRIRK